MCINCGIISDLFNATKQNPIIGSKRVYQLLLEMHTRGRLLVHTAAATSFEQLEDFLKRSQESEAHFYFECSRCGAYFQFSMDKDGQCTYGRVDQIPGELL